MATDVMLPDPAAAPPVATMPSVCSLPINWMDWTLADLQAHLGGIPFERIRLPPSPARQSRPTWNQPCADRPDV